MGKITVKHYLNKRLKSSLDSNENTIYPVYVRIIYNQNSTSFPSEILTPPSVTEERFLSAEIEEQKQYEVDIFTSILNFIESNKHDKPLYRINNLVSAWKYPVSYSACNSLLPNEKISEQISEYFRIKTGIELDVINTVLSSQKHSINILYKLSLHNIFDSNITKYINYIQILSDYANNKFGDDPSRYGIKNSLCYFEWVNKNERDCFRKYVIKNKYIPNADIDEFIEQIDIMLFNKMNTEIDFARYFVERKNR